MFSAALVAFVGLSLSAAAVQIQSGNAAFYNAGIQGCITVADNADGEPLIIHNCNAESLANQDWVVTFFTPQKIPQNFGPQQLQIFGDKCIDVTGGVNADGTKLQIWTCAEGNKNQQWVSVTDTTFQWAGTNKCIDLTNGGIADGNVLQIWTCDGINSNQWWKGEPNPDAVATAEINIRRLVDGEWQAFCIAAVSDTDGAEVTLAPCTESDLHTTFPNGNITWTVPVAPLTGQIKTFGNKCLDVPNGSTANGVKLQLWTCTEGNVNQLFRTNDGSAQIVWSAKGIQKCIDLTDGNSTIGNSIQMWDCAVPDNDENQDWFL
ncbi:hypothetical protein MVEN_00306100 [Mycena venus]|uniref:Ricin B lectin domain-containing protein n=1 Tax=Mycena venus TaxID=2733690 RepID=A0A8H7DBV1_9AGAR|nr:hypothetical protein MVEN_00306100 [Mycena venus]